MAQINVSPTRMELGKLKKRLATARRGHKLLKDKCDELMKVFLESVNEAYRLRNKAEETIACLYAGVGEASAQMSPEALEGALIYPKTECVLEVKTRNIMSVNVPEYDFSVKSAGVGIFGWGFAFTSSSLDLTAAKLNSALPDLIKLAETEKRSQLLADEIEKTRRRVNALEYTVIPQLESAVKKITMKLGENERGNLTRLMKVKDMMIKR